MNDEYDPFKFEENELPLDIAVQTLLAEPIPEDAIERVKTNARRLANERSTLPTRMNLSAARGDRSSRGIVAVLTLVLGLLVAVMSLNVPHHSSGQFFAQVIERVNSISSLRCTMATTIGKQPEVDGKLFLKGNLLRIEQFGGNLIQVANFDQKQALFLDSQRKVSQTSEINAEMAKVFANPVDQLRRAKSIDAQPIGEEILKGNRTQLYRLSQVDLLGMKGNAEMLVWIDATTQLPARIVIRDTDPKSLMEVRFEEFAWNAPLDDGLFALKAPDGFQPGVIVTTPGRSQPTKSEVMAPEFANGLLHDRVPAEIVMNRPGTTITALMRDPESVEPQKRKPNEIGQWDLVSGKRLWSEAVAGANSLAGTADGRLLATVIGFEVQLRDAATGKVTEKWATDKPLSPLAFSPDGKFLAAGITEWGRYGGNGGAVSGGVQFWDTDRASLAKTITDDKPVTFIKYSIDGKQIVTSSNEGPIKLWDTASGQLIHVFNGYGVAAFTPDGECIACVTAKSPAAKNVGIVGLYSVTTGSLMKSFASEPGSSPSYLLGVIFSPDGKMLAATDWNGMVTLWNAQSGERKRTIREQAGVLSAAFTPDGASLATGSEDKTLRIAKLPTE